MGDSSGIGQGAGRGGEEERAVVDRVVDGEHAVLLVGEDEVERIVPAAALPKGVGEGAWLRVRFDGGELVIVAVDEPAREAAGERVTSKMDLLRRRGSRLAKPGAGGQDPEL